MSDEPKNIFENLEKSLDQAVGQNEKICKREGEEIWLWDGGDWYKISFSDCDTHEELVKWVYQLSEKSWATREHIHLFLSHVFSEFKALAPE